MRKWLSIKVEASSAVRWTTLLAALCRKLQSIHQTLDTVKDVILDPTTKSQVVDSNYSLCVVLWFNCWWLQVRERERAPPLLKGGAPKPDVCELHWFCVILPSAKISLLHHTYTSSSTGAGPGLQLQGTLVPGTSWFLRRGRPLIPQRWNLCRLNGGSQRDKD